MFPFGLSAQYTGHFLMTCLPVSLPTLGSEQLTVGSMVHLNEGGPDLPLVQFPHFSVSGTTIHPGAWRRRVEAISVLPFS